MGHSAPYTHSSWGSLSETWDNSGFGNRYVLLNQKKLFPVKRLILLNCSNKKGQTCSPTPFKKQQREQPRWPAGAPVGGARRRIHPPAVGPRRSAAPRAPRRPAPTCRSPSSWQGIREAARGRVAGRRFVGQSPEPRLRPKASLGCPLYAKSISHHRSESPE